MKDTKLINKLAATAVCIALASTFVSCEQEFYKDEQYRKEIFIVSGEDNIFSQEFTFDKDAQGLLSIYAGGTESIDNDVTVTLEYNMDLLTKYNRLKHDSDYDNYALILPEDKYSVRSMSVTLKADNKEPYVLFPIHVDVNGLIPEEEYILPLSIASVSDYMIASKRKDVLLKIFMKNEYATTKSRIYYNMIGTTQKKIDNNGSLEIEGGESPMNSTKLVTPISEHGIRILPGTVQSDPNASQQSLRLRSVVAAVSADEWIDVPVISDEGEETGEFVKCQKVVVTPWFETNQAVRVKNMDDKPSYYNPEKKEFTLRYQYRIASIDGQQNNKDVWREVKEVMTPMDIKNEDK